MMTMDFRGVKIIILTILICGFSLASSELLRPPQPPQFNYAFNKFRPPPPPEPTFIQRITNWFFPWGGVSSEEEIHHVSAAPKIDFQPQQHHQQHQQHQNQQQHSQHQPISRTNPVQVRDTEPTTARTTQSPPITKCSPCNKEPWIPMMPTYQLPMVKPGGQQHVSFKHHFGNDAQFAHVPASAGYNYPPPTSTQPSTTPIKFQDGSNFIQGYQNYGVPDQSNGGYNYPAPTSTQPPTTTPLKFQDGSNYIQGHQTYGVPPTQNVPFLGYHYPAQAPNFLAQAPHFPTQASQYPRLTTTKPNTNTIDTSVITFTTSRPQNNRPLRYTAAGSVTNPEYLPPPNVLPLEGENGNFAPIPIPNLSPSPIPPLFDAKPFHDNPYRNQKTGFIKLVPLEPTAQLSNNVNVQVKPDRNLPRIEAVKESPAVEVISSNLVAEFTLPSENVRYEHTTRQPIPVRDSFGSINFDLGNNLDVNTTINSPIIVDSLETVTDTIGAASEDNYEHNIHQALESQFQQLSSSDDDTIDTEESNHVLPLRVSYQETESDELTTTEGNYIVQFEPSLQTAADLAEEEAKKEKSFEKNEVIKTNRGRLTPIELLDSPIFHVTPFTVKPKTSNFTEPPPPFKPMEDFTKKLATLWTSPLPISTSSDPTTTPIQTSVRTTETPSTLPPAPSTTLSFLSKVSSGAFSGITPPREPPKPAPSTKRPKQIQIIIPYTTFNKPSPFKIQEEQDLITYRPIRGHYVTHPSRTTGLSDVKNLNVVEEVKPANVEEKKKLKVEENFNGHGYHNDQEYHDHAQESKIVESKVTIEPTRATKYLTKILANNIRDLLRKEKTPKPPRVDLIRLQKNIDDWTEQSFKGKASTLSQTGHTKSIPKSFLTTTMKATRFTKIPTTTLSPRTTFDPALMEETKRQYDNILYKNDDDILYVKRHDRFLDRDNELVLLNNNLTFNTVHEGVKVFAPKTTLTPKELWKRLHLTVSPLTNEKIYVVTPQPRQTTEAEKVSTFRPRFSVRPTVAGKSQYLIVKLFDFQLVSITIFSPKTSETNETRNQSTNGRQFRDDSFRDC